MEKRLLERCLAKGMSLEVIGRKAGKHPSTVCYWLKKHGLSAVGSDKYSSRGGIDREILKSLAEEGATVAEIAEGLDRNPIDDSLLAQAISPSFLQAPGSETTL